MSSRHHAREIALQILYRYDVTAATGSEKPRDLSEDVYYHFQHFEVPADIREFTAQLVAGTLTNIHTIDELIEKSAANWKLSRMSFIDRNLLRMALYELLHCNDIPHSVTINEAVELAKQFGTDETPGFVNGILDAIKKALPES